MKTKIVSSLVAAAALFAANQAQATFNLSLRTTTGDSSDSGAARLYNGAAGDISDPSETTDPLWFVIDLDGDGVFNSGVLSGAPVLYDGTQAGLRTALLDADDLVYFTALNNAIQGRTLQNIVGIPSDAQVGGSGPGDAGGVVKPGFAILFDDANLLNGGTFGYDEVFYGQTGNTVNAIPTSGNLNARIGQNVFASSFSFAVVPEPSAAIYAGLGLVALAFYRKRSQRP